MSTDGQKAHGILLSYEPLAHYGACWHYVWKAYAAAGASTSHGSLATAYDAWHASYGKHPGDRNPPPGAAIWLGRRYSDGNMSGDVFIAGQHDGDHAATDQPGWGQTGLVSIQDRINLTGREYLGWTDHVLDCPIRLGGQPNPPAQEEDTTMNGMLYYRTKDDRRDGPIDGFALAGSGNGRAAWLEISDQALANDIAANTESKRAIFLARSTWDAWRAYYLGE